MTSLAHYLAGLAGLAVVLGALYFGAVRLRARLLPGWSGPPARLAEIVITLASLVLTLELVGVVGLYRPGFVLAGAILVGLATAYLAGPAREGVGPPAPEVGLVMVAIATAAAGLVAAHWGFPTQTGVHIGMYLPNSTWHNMPFAARFVQDHQVGSLHFVDPLKLAVWFYPQNSELLHSSGMLFLGNDFLSPLINMGWLAGALLAAWCIGRPYGAGAIATLGVAVLLDANMLLLYQPGDAKNDTMGLFFLLAAVAILVNADAARRASARQSAEGGQSAGGVGPATVGPLVVASLAAGLAMGTKINLLAAVGALTLGVIAISAAGERLRTVKSWVPGLVLGGGFWYLRNAIHSSGNPLPWITKGPLAGPDQLNIYVRSPHTVADYLTNGSVFRHWFFPALHSDFGIFWPAVLGLILGAIVLVIWRAETPTLRMLGFVTGVVAISYLFTPLTAAGPLNAPSGFGGNLRYLAPALVIAAALLPLVRPFNRPRWRYLLLGVLGLFLLRSLINSNAWDNTGYRKGAIALALILIVVPVATAIASRTGVRRVMIAAGLLVVLVGGLAYGRNRETAYLAARYKPATVPHQISVGIAEAMGATNSLHHQRIGLGGTEAGFKQYLFYGRDMSNYVQYLGEHGPNGTFRPISSCADFRRAVDAGHFRFLVIAPSHLLPYERPPEVSWIEPDRNSRLVETFLNVSVYRLNGPLDPAGCAALNPNQRSVDPLAGAHS